MPSNQTSDFVAPRLAYSVQELAVMTGLGTTTIYQLIAAGRLRTVKVGRRRIVPADSIRDLIDGAEAA